jgi:hypothetical protein
MRNSSKGKGKRRLQRVKGEKSNRRTHPEKSNDEGKSSQHKTTKLTEEQKALLILQINLAKRDDAWNELHHQILNLKPDIILIQEPGRAVYKYRNLAGGKIFSFWPAEGGKQQ